ncbi:MAG: tetratricopeptide repeat protein [Planctomycetaceae bacterium]|nr:tetratricopeptide repeat protein [Planctomycetaceae bacterium]
MVSRLKYCLLFTFTSVLCCFLAAATYSSPQNDPGKEEKAGKSVTDNDSGEKADQKKLEKPAEKNENKGLDALNQATEIKMSAETLRDLSLVIKLCEKAKEDGLTQENLEFCNQLLAATLIQRGIMISELVLERRPLPPSWKEYRKLAVTDFEEACKYLPEEPAIYLYIARLNLLPDGDRDLAASFADRTIKYCEGNDEMHAQALLVKAELGKTPEEQVALLREAEKILPNSVPILTMLGGVLATSEKFDEALEILKKSVELDPGNTQALEFTAAVLVEQEKFDEAIKVYDMLEKLQNGYMPKLQKAEVYQMQKKYDEALKILDALRSADPGNPLILLQRAKLYTDKKDYDSAMRDVESTLRLAADLPELEAMALGAKLTVLCEQKKYAEALNILKNLPEEKRNRPGYQLMLTQVYVSANANAKALEVIDGLLKDQPDSPELQRFRADILLSLGRHKESVDIYKKLLEKNDKDSGVYNNYAWVLATSTDDSLRDGKLALEYALKACELTKYKKPHILSTLASAYAELGDFDKAVEWSQKSVDMAVDNEHDQKDHLEKELKSYQEKKPWREKLDENAPDPSETPAATTSDAVPAAPGTEK